MKFEAVNNFKYLGINIDNENNMHRDLNKRIMSENRCIIKLQKLKLLSHTLKIRLCY